MGWSSLCTVARGPRHLTEHLWELVVSEHTAELPVLDYGQFLEKSQSLVHQLGNEGASVVAQSPKYEFTDALWDEIEPLLHQLTGIERYLHGDIEGIDYVLITDPKLLLGNLSATGNVKSRMCRALSAAVEQFTRDYDTKLDAVARRLSSGVCTTSNLPLDVRESQLVETIDTMEKSFEQARFAENYGSRSARNEKRRIAYQFALDHLRGALDACRELRQAQVDAIPTPVRSAGSSGSAAGPTPGVQHHQPPCSKREKLQAICREAATAGQHVVVVHEVL